MRILMALVICSAVSAMLASSAHAQSATAPRPEQDAACPPGVGADPPTVGSGDRTDLSEKLARSKGIICPPASADNEMAVQPPAGGGRTPVIPPPGSPGGDQSVQPK
jgi:hypothetical protein